MRNALSYEAIFAAVAVVALGAGCAKKDEPAKATAEAVPAAAQPPSLTAPASANAPADPAVAAQGVTAAPSPAVDAAVEAKKPAPRGLGGKSTGSAACGAGSCSADMKK